MGYIYINRSQVRPFADFAGRLSDLDAALKLEPDDPGALGEKATLLMRQGRAAEAVALYDQAMKTELDPDDWALSRAIALYKAGRTAEAQRAFDAVRSKAKTSSDWNRLCWRKAMFDVLLKSALEDCQQALRLDPNNKSIPEGLGLVYLKLDDRDAALKAYDKAVSERSGAAALMGRAIAYARKGDKVRAASDAAQARKMRPKIDDLIAEYGLASDLASVR
jgi:tetratricopeptide (TPR) repeat protein